MNYYLPLIGDTMAISVYDWGAEAGWEFAFVTISLALLLFIQEILSSTAYGTKKIKLILHLAIIPLFLVFIINILVVFLG